MRAFPRRYGSIWRATHLCSARAPGPTVRGCGIDTRSCRRRNALEAAAECDGLTAVVSCPLERTTGPPSSGRQRGPQSGRSTGPADPATPARASRGRDPRCGARTRRPQDRSARRWSHRQRSTPPWVRRAVAGAGAPRAACPGGSDGNPGATRCCSPDRSHQATRDRRDTPRAGANRRAEYQRCV